MIRKLLFTILFLLISFMVFSEGQTQKKPRFFLGGGFGSSYNTYSSPNTDTMTGVIDTGEYSRMPLYFSLYGGIPVYDNLNATMTFADIFERFVSSADYLQLNILQLYPSLEYSTPVKGLSFSAGWGFALLIAGTDIPWYNTSLDNGIEQGSVFQISAKYRFYHLKHGRFQPEAGVRLSHCELLNSTVTSFIFFVQLHWQ